MLQSERAAFRLPERLFPMHPLIRAAAFWTGVPARLAERAGCLKLRVAEQFHDHLQALSEDQGPGRKDCGAGLGSKAPADRRLPALLPIDRARKGSDQSSAEY